MKNIISTVFDAILNKSFRSGFAKGMFPLSFLFFSGTANATFSQKVKEFIKTPTQESPWASVGRHIGNAMHTYSETKD